MNEAFFWNSFLKNEKKLYIFLLSLLLISGLGLFFASIFGTQSIFGWDILSELEQIPTVIDTFSSGGLRFNINGYSFIVKERFLAAAMPYSPWLNIVFSIILAIGFSLILASLTTLRQNWFLGGSAIFGLVLASFQIKTPQIPVPYFGFWLSFLVLIGTAFWINTFRQYFPIWKRFLFFLAEIILLFIFFSYLLLENPKPLLGLVSFGMIAFLILSCVFIFMVSHEVITLLVWIITRNAEKGKNYNPHFFWISFIYLANLVLLYFKTSKTFGNWDGLFISPIMLLLVSSIIGLFYFKKWCDSTNYLRFESSGAWIYAGMLLITFSTILYAYLSGNDALTEFFDDFIVFVHLAMSIAFVFHVFVNFVQPLKKGLEVHKVIYKPVFSPLLVARMVGVALTVVLFVSKNNFPLWQATAGYLNGIGDFHRQSGDSDAAQKLYNDGLALDPFNHHGNYANGTIAWLKDDKTSASYFFKQATQRDGSEQAFAANSRFYQENDQYFDAIFTLQKGLKKFPNSAPLQTNLAMLYDKAQLNDSVFYYLNKAQNGSNPAHLSNIAAFWVKYGKGNELENIYKNISNKKADYHSFNANLNALQNKMGRFADNSSASFSLKDSALNVSSFALIFNRNVNKNPFEKLDFEELQNHKSNGAYTNDLIFARACRSYYGNAKVKGIQLLSLITKDESFQSLLSQRMLGMWLLQEGIYERGMNYLVSAGDSKSAEMIGKQDFKVNLIALQQNQAKDLLSKSKTKSDYDAALKKAPLNPFLVSKVSQFYSEKLKDDKSAYEFVSEALYLNETSPELLKSHAMIALKLGLLEYAETSLSKLKGDDFKSFNLIFQAEKNKKFSEFK